MAGSAAASQVPLSRPAALSIPAVPVPLAAPRCRGLVTFQRGGRAGPRGVAPSAALRFLTAPSLSLRSSPQSGARRSPDLAGKAAPTAGPADPASTADPATTAVRRLWYRRWPL